MDHDGKGGSYQARPFDTQREIAAYFLECVAGAQASLQLFDPDFRVFDLGHSETDAALRQFLLGGGSLQLAMHRSEHIERYYPRFIKLLRDYSHRIECRLTSKNLHHLT